MEPEETAFGQVNRDEEITLRELILKIQEFLQELITSWKLIALICLPLVLYKLYDAWTTPVVFPATLTFMVDEDEGNRLGGIANVLGQFGISGIQQGKYNLDKILKISTSRKVLQMALFTKAHINGRDDLLANHWILQNNLHKKWKDDTTGLRDFLFESDQPIHFTRLENRVWKSLQGLLNGSEERAGAYKTDYDEDTGIMRLRLSAPSERLAITLVDTIFAKLTNYYVGNATEKAESTYKVMKTKTDSLAKALATAEYRLAEFVDKNKNIYSARQGSLQQSRLATEVNRLQAMHGESIKNLEYTDFVLKNKTPFITLIDNPIPPLRPQRKSKTRALIVGLILGLMIGSSLVILRKIYRDTMAD